MIEFKTIKEAILKNRGGLEAATKWQILLIWHSLTPETQEKYLESVTTKARSHKEEKINHE